MRMCRYVCMYVTSIYTYITYTYITYMYMALYRQLEALRGKTLAAQSTGGILTRLIQSIICRGTSSPSALLPDFVGGFAAPTYFSISFLPISILNHHTRRPLYFLSHVCEYCDSIRITDQHIHDHHRWF